MVRDSAQPRGYRAGRPQIHGIVTYGLTSFIGVPPNALVAINPATAGAG